MSCDKREKAVFLQPSTARKGARAGKIILPLLCLLVALLASACAAGENENRTGNYTPQQASSQQQAYPTVGAATNAGGRVPATDAEQSGGNTESYSRIDENPFYEVAHAPLSTFSVDVDTASYSNTRRFLRDNQLPPRDAVRIEEFINYFSYDYPQPTGSAPFSVTAEVAGCPWNSKHRLVHIGLQARRAENENLPPSNLVFLVDVSGSMNEPNKLPLLQSSLKMLAEQLTARDRVSIVVYAGASGLVLPPTRGDRKSEIFAALNGLSAGGSTNGGQGIMLAYKVAEENFIKGGTNRVILATDGDFNVGVTGESELVRLIEEKRRGGVFLSVLGLGTGNLKDSTMEKLADKGNGNYAYIDSLAEARKVLGEQVGATLLTVAKDVKIQVEFNPQQVAGYRLIGYENRLLRSEDFNDDQKDAGEIGAGHSVTALYEIVPAGQKVEDSGVDPLKYQQPSGSSRSGSGGELLTVKLRYKAPDESESRLISTALADTGASFADASDNFKFSSAVAAFGMLLRDSKYKGDATYNSVLQLARSSTNTDLQGYRTEFVSLVESARTLSASRAALRN